MSCACLVIDANTNMYSHRVAARILIQPIHVFLRVDISVVFGRTNRIIRLRGINLTSLSSLTKLFN